MLESVAAIDQSSENQTPRPQGFVCETPSAIRRTFLHFSALTHHARRSLRLAMSSNRLYDLRGGELLHGRHPSELPARSNVGRWPVRVLLHAGIAQGHLGRHRPMHRVRFGAIHCLRHGDVVFFVLWGILRERRTNWLVCVRAGSAEANSRSSRPKLVVKNAECSQTLPSVLAARHTNATRALSLSLFLSCDTMPRNITQQAVQPARRRTIA